MNPYGNILKCIIVLFWRSGINKVNAGNNTSNNINGFAYIGLIWLRGEWWMVHPEKVGKKTRYSFSKINEVLAMPNLIDMQKDSYKWFLEEGLREVFKDISPIESFTGNLSLEFIDYSLEEEPKYSIEECKERDVNYAAPLRVKVRLTNKETGEIKEQEIFMGDFPLMTDGGTFIINGVERVIVSQLVRSPGPYYVTEDDKSGRKIFTATMIPNRGAWLEYEIDQNNVFSVRIDKTRKLPITVFLRALGFGSDSEIFALFGDDERLKATIDKDNTKNEEEGLLEVYRRLRPGEPPTVDGAKTLVNSLFFDAKRYDLAKVGRYKFNKKLVLSYRIIGQKAAEDIINPETGEILVKAGEVISREKAREIDDTSINSVMIKTESKAVTVLGNNTVDITRYPIPYSVDNIITKERVNFRVLNEILDGATNQKEFETLYEDRYEDLVPKYITKEDILASISYMINLPNEIGTIDDIDHLGNRRLRTVGELLQNQFRIGLARLERVVKERMTIQDLDVVTPQALINIRPVVAAIKEFFGSSQLSQFMDQHNPLAELTNKRRLSALGPGGLSRERAGLEVRDVHNSHYSRICPIETPEGPNIGLIGSLATYARINEYGFIEAPYRRVDKEKCIATHDIDYMTADVEDGYIIAQANEPLDEEGHFVNERVTARLKDDIIQVQPKEVDYMDVSPKQIVSVATAMIPFLENDDANRALMGANMQRQAVPLIKPESPIVGTGIEYKAAKDSGSVVVAKSSGTVEKVTADEIVVKKDNGERDIYNILKFKRSNQGTCINQKPIVSKSERVEKGDVIADGPATDMGDIALGRNVLIAFMPWEGYNYEDAVMISENLVMEDAFTSIHIEEYETEARDTKLGPEEITREIPNVGEDAIKDMDERGIIRIGAEVTADDILVGKVTPKGETELTAEERLLRAIFGEKAREVRDTSLRVPHGEGGIIVDVKVFTRANGDELPPGVNELVRVYVAQKRKISVGDKMSGRHGNKGVVSRILPAEDMPFLPDGRPIDIVLNPLGVPSRMNLGQVLEVHLGMVAKALGWYVSTPVFDGATEEDIVDLFRKVGLPEDGKTTLYDGRSGEPFENRVTVGYMYMLKLHHLVDDKMHARSTGPYSLVTQQPLGGKAQFGGQRFGEMEVWALEAYGAAHTLQEILTVKSDDVVGRVKAYEAIVKGENITEPGVPESFKVLIKELQSLALDVKVLTEDNKEIELKEFDDDEDEEGEDLDINIEGSEDAPPPSVPAYTDDYTKTEEDAEDGTPEDEPDDMDLDDENDENMEGDLTTYGKGDEY